MIETPKQPMICPTHGSAKHVVVRPHKSKTIAWVCDACLRKTRT